MIAQAREKTPKRKNHFKDKLVQGEFDKASSHG